MRWVPCQAAIEISGLTIKCLAASYSGLCEYCASVGREQPHEETMSGINTIGEYVAYVLQLQQFGCEQVPSLGRYLRMHQTGEIDKAESLIHRIEQLDREATRLEAMADNITLLADTHLGTLERLQQ